MGLELSSGCGVPGLEAITRETAYPSHFYNYPLGTHPSDTSYPRKPQIKSRPHKITTLLVRRALSHGRYVIPRIILTHDTTRWGHTPLMRRIKTRPQAPVRTDHT